MNLVHASTESGCNIETYISDALSQLTEDMNLDPESLELVTCARKITDECETMCRTMDPFSDTLMDFTLGIFPDSIMGRSKPAWNSLAVMQKRLSENMAGEKLTASALVEKYRDSQAKRDEERQKRMERSSAFMGIILSIFSPLGFYSGIYGMNFVKSDGTPGIVLL